MSLVSSLFTEHNVLYLDTCISESPFSAHNTEVLERMSQQMVANRSVNKTKAFSAANVHKHSKCKA